MVPLVSQLLCTTANVALRVVVLSLVAIDVILRRSMTFGFCTITVGDYPSTLNPKYRKNTTAPNRSSGSPTRRSHSGFRV